MRLKNGLLQKEPVLFFMMFSLINFLSSAAASAETSAPSGNSCIACHQDTWEVLKSSIHGQQGIYCNRCHGGDPTKADKESAKAPGTGYIGVPDKKQLVQMCGQCHADVETMNFFGTRTDQLALYKTSHHGKKLLLEGDEKVAACSDCHGYHDVVKVTDPESPVYPLNVPKTCAQCHANEKLMAKHGLPSDIFKIYKTSVHGKALLEKKDISVAQCASCHGSHGAMPPGVKEISAACGKCHINEKKYFLESVHAKITDKGKFSECVSCHGNHGVQPPTPALFEQACLKCHEPGSPAGKQAQGMSKILHDAQTELKSTQDLVRQASFEGIFVEEEMAALEEAKTNVISMGIVQHTLSMEKISDLAHRTSEVLDGVRSGIQNKKVALRKRRIMLIPIWIFVIVMSAALWIKYKQLKHKKKNGGGHKHG